MDLDLALREEKPIPLTDQSTPIQTAFSEKWERSNRLSLMLMKARVGKNIQNSIPKFLICSLISLSLVPSAISTRFKLGQLLGWENENQSNLVESIPPSRVRESESTPLITIDNGSSAVSDGTDLKAPAWSSNKDLHA